MAEAGDILVQLHVHQPVFAERVHARASRSRAVPGSAAARGSAPDRPASGPRCSGVSGIRCRVWIMVASVVRGRGRNAGGLGEELADRDRIGGVVGALVDHLQHVVRPEDRRRHLHAAGAPAIGHRHFAAGERHLIAGDRDRLQDGAADHPLGLLVEIGEVVGWARSFGGLLQRRDALPPLRTPGAACAAGRARPGSRRNAAASRCSTKPVACTLSECDSTNSSSCAGAVDLLAEFARAQRAVDQRHRHGLALALAERRARSRG